MWKKVYVLSSYHTCSFIDNSSIDVILLIEIREFRVEEVLDLSDISFPVSSLILFFIDVNIIIRTK